MNLTRRGWVVLGIVIVAILSAVLFGPRGLNAVAAPGVVALLAGVAQVWRLDRPALEREAPARGHRGGTVRVRLHFDVGKPFGARVYDAVGRGLEAEGNIRDTTIGRTTVAYDVRLVERGDREIGPASVRAHDVLGLVSTTFRYDETREILVRPRVHALTGTRREDLVRLYGGASDQRQQFEHLREYRRGDPVRDIHWKSSAKLPEGGFAVKEFATDEGTQIIEIGGRARTGHADAMADALASIAVDLLDAGVSVGVTTPADRIEPDDGGDHRDRILDRLAHVGDGGRGLRTGRGRLTGQDRSRLDVFVEASNDGVRVDIDGRACWFEELAGPTAAAAAGAFGRPAGVTAA